jgi:hypothetical protein
MLDWEFILSREFRPTTASGDVQSGTRSLRRWNVIGDRLETEYVK